MDESIDQRVAKIVGRALDPSEIAKYPSMDALPAAVTDLVAVVAMKHNTVLAARYLFERVHGSTMDIEERVHSFTEQWMSRWTPRDEIEAREIVGHELVTSKTTFEDMKDASSNLTAVTLKLALHDSTLACKYVLQRVPGLHLWGAMSWLENLLDAQP